MILLQAAMGYGILLILIGCALLLSYPVVITLLYLILLKVAKKKKPILQTIDYFIVFFKSLFFSTLIILTIAIMICFFLELTVDLTYS
jgi:hypothetical protein